MSVCAYVTSGAPDRDTSHPLFKYLGMYVHQWCATTPPFFENLLRFRWRWEGAPGQVGRPGSRPALLGRPGHISGVPSRPKHPAQPLALDVGSPRAAQAAGICVNSSHVTRSPHPANPAGLYGPCACSKLSRRVCILRGSRTAGGSSRFETQGCTADGTAYSPELWRAATSASIC